MDYKVTQKLVHKLVYILAHKLVPDVVQYQKLDKEHQLEPTEAPGSNNNNSRWIQQQQQQLQLTITVEVGTNINSSWNARGYNC